MSDYVVTGELQLDGPVAHGWCWSPDNPRQRLRVELLMDGNRVGASVAARHRLDLVREGLCDGYHGFSLALPDAYAEFAVLEARETGTGQVFGRRLGKTADSAAWRTRTAALGQQLAALHEAVPHHPRGLSASWLAAGLGEAGRGVMRRPKPPNLSAGFRLPVIETPQFSVVLDAVEHSEAALATVAALAPLLRRHAAELLVLDNGHEPASAALASLAGLAYCLTRAASPWERINHGIGRAHGSYIAIFDAALSTQQDISNILASFSGSVVAIGRSILQAVKRAGFPDLAIVQLAETMETGLVLLAPAILFTPQGGVSRDFGLNSGLSELSFVRAAMTRGYDVRAWT